MSFHSLVFLLGFLPLALGGYAVAGRRGAAWARGWLLAMSLLFYGLAAPRFLPLLVVSTAGNLGLLHAIARSRRRGWIAAAGCALNLALLGWFKYLDADAGLPLGISFWTFSQIGCLLWQAGSDEPAPPAGAYALFVLFFPAVTAGPILNPREMLPQFARTDGWGFSADDLAVGAGFFLIGLLKKAVLADPLSAIVGPGFADPASLSLLPAWQTATAWSLQLYFDFSGYSDMAIGLAWVFGFRFPDNFDQPYRARSVTDYWQRWHMSLTRFLMANVHAPLTLAVLRRRRRLGLPINQAAQQSLGGFCGMIAAPIVVTMVLAGVWHGSALTFLLFGLLHAGFLVVNHAWRLWRAPPLPPPVSIALTYLCVLIGSVVFRADTVGGIGAMLAGMMGLHGAGGGRFDVRWLWIAGLYGVVWFAPSTRQFMQASASGPAWRPDPRWAVAMGCAATLGLLASGGTGEFVYFRF